MVSTSTIVFTKMGQYRSSCCKYVSNEITNIKQKILDMFIYRCFEIAYFINQASLTPKLNMSRASASAEDEQRAAVSNDGG